MSKFPAYTAEENLMRIIMDKNTKYLLVEGPFDTAIYSELVSAIISKYNITHETVTVHGGGKQSILKWIENKTPKNLSIILDMDFDNPDLHFGNKLITSLEKYSIENYFFDEEVTKPLVANLLSKSINEIDGNLSLTDLKEHWNSCLMELMHVLFYYQKIHPGNKEKWNSKFINKGSGSWEICPDRVSELKSEVLLEMNKTYEECEAIFSKHYNTQCKPDINFPGKLLLESFHRYLKSICNNEKDGAYSVITNPKCLVSSLSGRLINNIELERIVHQAIT